MKGILEGLCVACAVKTVREARCVLNITLLSLSFPFLTILPLCSPHIHTHNNKTIFSFSQSLSAESILVKSFFQAILQGYRGTNLRTWPFKCLLSFSSNLHKVGGVPKLYSKLFCFTHMPTNIILIHCGVRILFLIVGLL